MRVLNYQPFIITDDIQTGAAYSWAYGVQIQERAPVVFRRSEWEREWDKVTESNGRLRRMYDDFMTEIAGRYRGGSFLDVACNNGYFPVRAHTLGMRQTAGADAGDFGTSIRFLNDILGTSAKFIHAPYDPSRHGAPIRGEYDVVSASAIMCHLPDPLNFLAFLGGMAREAIFFFGQVIDTDALLTVYFPPHPALAANSLPFPYVFNDNTRVSRGLLYLSFERMGFKNIVEIPWRDEWLSPYYRADYRPPQPDEAACDALTETPYALAGYRTMVEIREGSKHIAILAMR